MKNQFRQQLRTEKKLVNKIKINLRLHFAFSNLYLN